MTKNPQTSLTAKEQAKLFVELKDLFHNTGQNSGYDKEDIRSNVFFHCRDFTVVVLIALIQMSRVEEKLISEDEYPLFFGIDNKYAKYTFDHYLQFNRYGYVTFVMFHIENCLKIILRELTGKNVNYGYYPICKNLLDNITIDNPEKKLDILLVPSFMRNSFHSNGIHTKESCNYVISDYDFEFTKGNTVTCAGWFHIYIMMKEMINVLKEILKTKEIQNITKILPDQYIPN